MGQNNDQMRAELEQLREENAKLRSGLNRSASLGLKVGEKGGVSVTGMGRFPVTLYREQWERLIAFVPQIEAFIAENAGKLSTKDGKKALVAGETRAASGAIVGEPEGEAATPALATEPLQSH